MTGGIWHSIEYIDHGQLPYPVIICKINTRVHWYSGIRPFLYGLNIPYWLQHAAAWERQDSNSGPFDSPYEIRRPLYHLCYLADSEKRLHKNIQLRWSRSLTDPKTRGLRYGLFQGNETVRYSWKTYTVFININETILFCINIFYSINHLLCIVWVLRDMNSLLLV